MECQGSTGSRKIDLTLYLITLWPCVGSSYFLSSVVLWGISPMCKNFPKGSKRDWEDTNSEENTKNQYFDSENLLTKDSVRQVSDFEFSDDDFEKDWTKLKVDCFMICWKTWRHENVNETIVSFLFFSYFPKAIVYNGRLTNRFFLRNILWTFLWDPPTEKHEYLKSLKSIFFNWVGT